MSFYYKEENPKTIEVFGIIYYKVLKNNIEYDVQEYKNGYKYFYCKSGYLCILENNEYIAYYKNFDGTHNPSLHKEDRAAVIHSDGTKEYWLNGIRHFNVNSDDEWIIYQIIE